MLPSQNGARAHKNPQPSAPCSVCRRSAYVIRNMPIEQAWYATVRSAENIENPADRCRMADSLLLLF